MSILSDLAYRAVMAHPLRFFGQDNRAEEIARLFRHDLALAVKEALERNEVPFRVGTRVPRHVYEGDTPLFTANSDEEAARLVEILNKGRGITR